MHGPCFKHRCTPDLLQPHCKREQPRDTDTGPGGATEWINALYTYPGFLLLEEKKLFVWILLLQFSLICNKMYFWLEYVLCYHDKTMPCIHFKNRHKARMSLLLLSFTITLEVLANSIRQVTHIRNINKKKVNYHYFRCYHW